MKAICIALALGCVLSSAATAKESCRLVGEPKANSCEYFTPSGRLLCDGPRCVELVAFPPECLQERVVCAEESAFREGRVK